VRLAIPVINLDTPVAQAGIVQDTRGEWVWQTLPFVAVHYGDLTSLVGADGNAVIAGHVVTLNEGNVFRFLYKLRLGDEIQVWDQHDREYDYQVVGMSLVRPSDTSVMDPTPDQTLTLITCGGSFDRIRREFSDRLIVTAKRLPEQ
jgi:LPXTG-site transpeptidase (sortase) family protein